MDSAAAQIDEIQVALLRAIASTHRLRIIHALGHGPLEVGELAAVLGLPSAATSTHLAALRAVGLLDSTREGRCVRYRLADPQVLAACDLMRDVIVRRLSRLGSLVEAAAPQFTAPYPAEAHR